MGKDENSMIGKLFLFYGGILLYSSLFVQVVKGGAGLFFYIISIGGIIVYLLILMIHIIDVYSPNEKRKYFFESKIYLNSELVFIVLFGVWSFINFSIDI